MSMYADSSIWLLLVGDDIYICDVVVANALMQSKNWRKIQLVFDWRDDWFIFRAARSFSCVVFIVTFFPICNEYEYSVFIASV